ncbi:SRPBCC family protein [Natrinema marinum]|uniref:SRPBCC family protein n=1 Tax=Natrinema marinum TaxID=2961598 RepID=UPI0020C88929|nr:SRPBCC family protein [Natrinema marinum]
MTVRVDRSFEVAASPERVWEFIADPSNRAQAISVVEEYSVDDPAGRRATWHVELPIPLVRKTVSVDTEDVTRTPPEYVKFVGRSKVLKVTGEHEIVETDEGARLENRFVVDGKLPGVEKFFKRNLDSELENLQRALERDLRTTQ